MGKVRPISIKRAAREFVEKFEDKLSIDFDENKQVVNEFMETGSKRIRNRAAGYVTRLMRIKANLAERSVIDLPEEDVM